MTSSIESKVAPFGQAVDIFESFLKDEGTVETPTGPLPSLRALVGEIRADASEAVAEEIGDFQAVAEGLVAVKDSADAAADRAELARDASFALGPKYPDEPTGRAAVADGAAFLVQGSGDVAAFEHRRISAAVSTLIATYPSKVAVDKKAPGVYSKNLFNPAAADVVLGAFPVNTTGALSANAGYNTTGFMPVEAGQQYTVSPQKHYWCWYNAAKAFISGTSSADLNATQTAPAGAAFARVSASTGAYWTNLQFELGAAYSGYEPYTAKPWLDPSSYKPKSITGAAVSDGAIAVTHAAFIQPGKNLFNPAAATIGYFLPHDGNPATASATYDYSDFIKVTPGQQLYGKGAKGMRFVTCYNAVGVFMAGGVGVADPGTNTFTVPAGVAYIRVTIWHTDKDVFQLEVGNAPTSFEAFAYRFVGPNAEQLLAQIPASSVLTAHIAAMAVTPPKTNFLLPTKNLFNKAAITSGYIMSSGGGVIANASYGYSDLIPVTPGQQYVTATTIRMWCFFNAGGAGVVAGGSDTAAQTFTAPAGAAFVRITVPLAGIDAYMLEAGATATGFVAFGYELRLASGIAIVVPGATSTVTNAWSGKTWAPIGDSITAANGYQPVVAAALGLLVPVNYGIGGTKLSGAAGDTNAMCQDARINAVPTTIDLVTVAPGTNDWAQNVPLGGVTSTDPTTFNGAFNTFMAKAMARWPDKRIAFQTTPYGEIYNFAPRGWPNAFTNTLGLTTLDYAEASRVQCKRWGIPVIEVAANAGWNTLNIRTFVSDDGALLHPLPVGYKRMAESYIATLKACEPRS